MRAHDARVARAHFGFPLTYSRQGDELNSVPPSGSRILFMSDNDSNTDEMAGGGDPKWQKDAADQNFDYMFKLLIIGNSSVGKTSFLFRYADDSFTSAFVSTVGIDFKVKTVFRHDKRVKLQIWVSVHNAGQLTGMPSSNLSQ
ncbi:Ras-related protein Rab-3 [Eumeta japonica]|uniref:Ras-related protein Rab-3 n=1 Tax=Eumeta variegata TaxID=151549 RepID=A0A4C1TM01_EUMVA|nr:Ras-related protein Rab-3 [Eumeta japonica]